jgi:hypothetical protein
MLDGHATLESSDRAGSMSATAEPFSPGVASAPEFGKGLEPALTVDASLLLAAAQVLRTSQRYFGI